MLMPLMRYVSNCAANRRVFNADINCRCSTLGPEETLVTSIQMTGPAMESVHDENLLRWCNTISLYG